MDDQVLYDIAGVRVTRSLLQLDGTTYAMANISSVTKKDHPPAVLIWWLAALASGLIMATIIAADEGGGWGGMLCPGILVLIAITRKTRYELRFTTNTGTFHSWTTTDGPRRNEIHAAIERAIVALAERQRP